MSVLQSLSNSEREHDLLQLFITDHPTLCSWFRVFINNSDTERFLIWILCWGLWSLHPAAPHLTSHSDIFSCITLQTEVKVSPVTDCLVFCLWLENKTVNCSSLFSCVVVMQLANHSPAWETGCVKNTSDGWRLRVCFSCMYDKCSSCYQPAVFHCRQNTDSRASLTGLPSVNTQPHNIQVWRQSVIWSEQLQRTPCDTQHGGNQVRVWTCSGSETTASSVLKSKNMCWNPSMHWVRMDSQTQEGISWLTLKSIFYRKVTRFPKQVLTFRLN